MNVPSNQHIRPSNLLLFELIWYRGNKGKVNDHDHVGAGVCRAAGNSKDDK